MTGAPLLGVHTPVEALVSPPHLLACLIADAAGVPPGGTPDMGGTT